MTTLRVFSTTDYSAQTLSPLVEVIDFSDSANFATATFSGSQLSDADSQEHHRQL
jgi:hypothetical protein